MFRKCKVFLCSVLIVGMLGSINVFATIPAESEELPASTQVQEGNRLSESDKDALKNFLRQYGADEATISNLLKKCENGELWNSLDPQYKSTATHETFSNENGITVDKYVYPDGSIMIQELSSPITTTESGEVTINTVSIGGGTVTQGSGFLSVKGAKVSYDFGMIKASFNADYTFANGAYDKIDKIYDYSMRVIGGSYQNLTFKITKQIESSTGPATARLQADTFLAGNMVGITFWIQLNVGSETAWGSETDTY